MTFKELLTKLSLGFFALLGSKKGVFSLLIFAASLVAVLTGKISGGEFVAALTISSTIYCASTAATDIQSIRSGAQDE